MTPAEAAELLGLPAPLEIRQCRHGCVAVLIPRGLSAAQENELRAALGVPPRSTTRRRKAA